MKKSVVVLYHMNCLDGFGSAWVAWKKFGSQAQYYAVAPHQLPSDAEKIINADVYVIDSSLSLENINKLHKQKCTVTVLDHHISSEADVKQADDYVFDIKHSGAMLAWNYFFPKTKTPHLITYVEDGDLWNFAYPETDLIRNMLVLQGFDLKKWNTFARNLENSQKRKKILTEGKVVEQYRNELIKQSVEHAYLVHFEGYLVYAINETTEAIRSEVAHKLYEKHPPFAIVWALEKDAFHVSLRSNGSVDVSVLAKKYGGGGHKAASGFLWPAGKPLPWILGK
jgi:oligoribonuclease NrnB/cAMP/cGMP phosphodiesterase (DHH superfamily)